MNVKEGDAAFTQTITATLVVPCLNEEKFISALFKSIDAQKVVDQEIEVIFVDGMSSDRTILMLTEYASRHNNVKVLNNPKKTVPHAMNIGIRAASGEMIIRLDAHAEYADDYVEKCIKVSNDTKAENVGGAAPAKGTGYIGKVIELSHGSPFGLGGGRFRLGNYEGYADTVFLGAFKKEIFHAIGYYDERLTRNQDIELNARIRKAGGKIYLSPEICSTYKCRTTISGLWKQNFSNGVWAVYTRAVAPHTLSYRHFVPLFFVMALIVGFFTMLITNLPLYARIMPLATMLGVYIVANLLFSLAMAIRAGIRYFLVLPIVFATLHFSYGIGSLWGLATLRKWIRRQAGHGY